MGKKSYSELLQDPRWQKKRLEIMQRDNFKCTQCGSGKNTLHVHHLKYTFAKPWEYENKDLKTLCVNCHKDAHFEIEMVEEGILKVSDFVKKHPEVTKLFTKIENHEGNWRLTIHEKAKVSHESISTPYQQKVFQAIYNLKQFAGYLDHHIFLVEKSYGWENDMCYRDAPRHGQPINFYNVIEDFYG